MSSYTTLVIAGISWYTAYYCCQFQARNNNNGVHTIV